MQAEQKTKQEAARKAKEEAAKAKLESDRIGKEQAEPSDSEESSGEYFQLVSMVF